MMSMLMWYLNQANMITASLVPRSSHGVRKPSAVKHYPTPLSLGLSSLPTRGGTVRSPSSFMIVVATTADFLEDVGIGSSLGRALFFLTTPWIEACISQPLHDIITIYMIKDIIACNWTLPNYSELAEQQKENLANYGIECINLTDSVTDADRQIKMYKERSPYFATKDRAQLDFVKSCFGKYNKVLCLDAEVRCHKPLPTHWLHQDSSRVWLYSSGFTQSEGHAKTVNIGEIIWRPEDADVFQLAIDTAKTQSQGYDIEFTVASAFHDMSRMASVEKINVSRFRHLLSLDNLIKSEDSQRNFLGCEVFTGDCDGKIGYTIPGNDASCTNGWIDDMTIFTHPSIFAEKMRPDLYLKKIHIDDLIGSFAKTEHDLALLLYDWLMDHPLNHEANVSKLRETKRLRSKGSLRRNLPVVMKDMLLKEKHLSSEVYEIDGWIICPELNLIGLPNKWSTNVLIYDTGYGCNILWSGVQDIVDRTSH